MSSLFPPPSTTEISGGLPQHAKSILIHGDYPSSAVIYYAISSLAKDGENSRAILISPSKHLFEETLVQYNDKWLNDNASKVNLIPLLERITHLFVN